MPSAGLMAPKQYDVFNPEYKKGDTVNYAPLKQAIGTGPRQVANPLVPQAGSMGGLSGVGEQLKLARDGKAPLSGQTSDMDMGFKTGWYSPQDRLNAQPPAWSSGTPFSLDAARQAIDTAAQPASPIAVNAPQYGTAADIARAAEQVMASLRPQVEVQKGAAREGYNQAMQGVNADLARRGMLRSGAAISQARQGAENLAQSQAAIEAAAQAQSIPLALQYGHLGLQEAGQLFNQQDANRQFSAEQAQRAAANLLQGLSQQEQARQYDSSFGLDVERLRSQENQNYLNQLANQLNMEQQAGQWAQGFGLDRQAADFGRWLNTNQLNSQNANAYNQALLEQARLAQGGDQWQQQFGMQQGEAIADNLARERQFGLQEQQQALAGRQANLDAALAVSQLLGRAVSPTDTWGDLFTRGESAPYSLAGRTGLGGLTGVDPVTGQRTLQGQQMDAAAAADQLRAQAAMISATRPQAVREITPKQQLENQIYTKLAAGQPLTDSEAAMVGIENPKGVSRIVADFTDDFNQLKAAGLTKEQLRSFAEQNRAKFAKDSIPFGLVEKAIDNAYKVNPADMKISPR